MFTRFTTIFLSLALVTLFLAACSGSVPTPAGPDNLGPTFTAAAQTLQAIATQSALFSTQLPPQEFPTQTIEVPTETPLPVPATNTPLPLPTSTALLPTSIPVKPISTVVSRCDWAGFVKDITVPDGTPLKRSESFTKTWRLKNIGTCTWTTSYSLVFVSGNSMNSQANIKLPGNVAPGQTIDVSVKLTAPNSDGSFRGYWGLRNASNGFFGIGANADTSFWVDIKVVGPSYAAMDFSTHFCSAEWRNASSILPCPGSQGDSRGFVIRIDAPYLEDGSIENEPALLTYPQSASDGFIQGKFPAVTVQAGDRFRSVIGCQYNSSACNVIFRLDYQIGDSAVKTLAQWKEIYDGKYYDWDVDLSPLAGKQVKFILTVLANGSANQDNALWLAPRLTRQGNATATPTATATATATPSPTASPTPEPTETDIPTPEPSP